MDTEKLKKQVGEKLRIKRKNAGYRQYELAKILGAHSMQVSDWELGKRPIPTKYLYRIPMILHCSLDDLNTLWVSADDLVTPANPKS